MAYSNLRGNKYIPLPKNFNKGNIINPKNKDDNCFIWSLILHKYHKKIKSHKERLSHYIKIIK